MAPYDDADPGDPFEIVGVVLEEPMDDVGIEAMARCFIEEYALLGWPAKRIRSTFRLPFFAAAHAAHERLGEGRIDELIEEAFGAEEGVPDA